MKYAKSMRYGGILVDACECDHRSYTRLGLLCEKLNTGHTKFQAFSKSTSTLFYQALLPSLEGLAARERIKFELPEPGYFCTVTLSHGAAAFDVNQGDDVSGLMVTCFVAWTQEGSDNAWELLSTTYEGIIRPMIKESPKSEKPKSLPWLSVILIPNPAVIPYPSWLANFEYCMAELLIGRS